MQKSYVARATINFIDYEFYIRPGDLLVHNTSNQNRLTVYRNGQIVKIAKQEPIGIAAFLKNKYIEEVVSTPDAPVAAPVPVVASLPVEVVPEPTPEPIEVLEAKPDRKAKVKKEEPSIADVEV